MFPSYSDPVSVIMIIVCLWLVSQKIRMLLKWVLDYVKKYQVHAPIIIISLSKALILCLRYTIFSRCCVSIVLFGVESSGGT